MDETSVEKKRGTKKVAEGRLFVAGLPHAHPGALLVATGNLDPVCGFCGRPPDVAEVSAFTCDAKRPPLLDPHLFEEHRTNHVVLGKMLNRARRFAKAAAGLEVGSRWNTVKVASAPTRPTSAPEAAGYHEISSVRGYRDVLATLFRDVLATGEDWLAPIAARVEGGDTPAAVAGVALLSLRQPARPAWCFNPALPPDPAPFEAIDAAIAREELHFTLCGLELPASRSARQLELARLTLLARAAADPRAEVAYAALEAMTDHGLPADAPVVRPWRWIDAPLRTQLLATMRDAAGRAEASAAAVERARSVLRYLGEG